jgi:fructan beta-fructosidase
MIIGTLISGMITLAALQSSTGNAQPPATAEPSAPAGLYHETWRPQFHFTPRENWTNDPNGLVYYKGEYHLFFQHNPKGREWGNMTWGQAVSPDLLHWKQLPNAIEPDALGTIFSGSAVVDWNDTAGFQTGDEKTLSAIYTAAGGTSPESKGQPFTQCLAYSNDRGRTWTKYARNPVLGHIIKENRDPKVVWHAPTRKWIMGLFKDGNTYALFSSPNLKDWRHLQDITVPNCGECPDFFEMPIDGDKGKAKWVFTAANGHYLVGSFDGRKFTAETGPHQVDYGKNFYAVQTYSDIPRSDDRRIQIAWMNGGKYPDMPFNQQMSFPCELRLHTFPEGQRLTRLPVKEIERLRGRKHAWTNEPLAPGRNLLKGINGDLFEIRAEIEPRDAESVGFKIRGEPVTWSAKNKKLSCLGAEAPLEPLDGRIRLHILVDRTSIEVFGNDGRVSLTSCFLPAPDNRSLETTAAGPAAQVISLEVYELRSAWPQR